MKRRTRSDEDEDSAGSEHEEQEEEQADQGEDDEMEEGEEQDGEEEDDEEMEEVEGDPELAHLTQQLNKKTNRELYDPSQSKEERRQIRIQYRKLISRTEENRKDYVNKGNNGLYETVQKANIIYNKVKNTQEATLDSRLLVLSADLGNQKARNLRLESQMFSVDEFITKVRRFGRPRAGDVDEGLDWKRVGERAFQFSARVQSIDFMLGPLRVEKKQRKVTRQVRIVKNKEDLVQPTQLQESDIQQQENETLKNVNAIWRILDERGQTNYFQFVTNPESFSQTVENIFYVSFLIRNGVAEIDDSSGQPLLRTRAPPTVDEQATIGKKQLIMNIDIPMWKEIIRTYGIQQPIVPTREKRQAVSSGKWY